MPPNEKDKEKLVIDLLKKGYKTREIAKMAHVSNTTVKKIRAKLTGEAKEEQEQKVPKEKTIVRFITGIQSISRRQIRCPGRH